MRNATLQLLETRVALPPPTIAGLLPSVDSTCCSGSVAISPRGALVFPWQAPIEGGFAAAAYYAAYHASVDSRRFIQSVLISYVCSSSLFRFLSDEGGIAAAAYHAGMSPKQGASKPVNV